MAYFKAPRALANVVNVTGQKTLRIYAIATRASMLWSI
jgi:hypothetical protein